MSMLFPTIEFEGFHSIHLIRLPSIILLYYLASRPYREISVVRRAEPAAGVAWQSAMDMDGCILEA